MKKIIWILVVLALAAGGYFAYIRIFSTNDLVASIPKDAAVVIAVDLKSIATKAGGEKLLNMEMIKRMREEMKKQNDPSLNVMNELFEDPMKSGLNFLNRAYMFVTVKNDHPVFGLVCGLLSSSTFESMLKKFSLKDSIVNGGDMKTMKFEKSALMGWNSKQVVFLGGMSEAIDPAYMKDIFAHASSVSSIGNFNKFNDTKFDAGVFINYGVFMAMSKGMAAGPVAMMGDLYKDTYADVTTVFENNSIVSNMHYYIDNKDMEKKLMMMNDKGISEDHLKLISDKKVLGILSMSFDPKKFIELFDTNPMLAGMLIEVASQAGITKDELKDLLTGDISLAFTDVRSEPTRKLKYNYDHKTGAMSTEEVADTSMMPMFTGTIGIKTRATFDKLMKRTGLQKEGPYYMIKAPGITLYMVENKVGVTITDDKSLADKIADKKELGEIGDPAKGIVRDNALGFYMDLDYKNYPEILFTKMHEQIGEDGFSAFKNTTSMLKDFEMKGGKNGSAMELKLTDGNGDNSLYRILDAIDKNVYPLVAKQELNRRKGIDDEEQEAMNRARLDSVAAAVATSAPVKRSKK